MKRTILGTMLLGTGLLLVPDGARAQAPEQMAEGARLYGQQCVRCHNARSPTERNDRQWLTIINHMRARANLTRAEAEALIVFMQATNSPEVPAALRLEENRDEEDPEAAGTSEGGGGSGSGEDGGGG